MNRAQLNEIRQMARELQAQKLASIERIIHGGLWSYVCPNGEEPESSFSWGGCERCNIMNSRRLGADVFTVTGWESLEEERAGAELQEHDLCHECIYTLVYGIES